MKQWRSRLACVPLLLALSVPVQAQSIPVDLQLVLAVDSSGSIDADEFRLQRRGYVAAFSNPAVLEAITSGYYQAVAVTMVEWSSYSVFVTVVDWTVISDAASAGEFADAVAASSRAIPGGGTSISGAIDYSSRLFDRNDYESDRRVIDISGDGRNNSGRLPSIARDEAVNGGITINGLAILNEDPTLDGYYREHVIGGSGSFVMAVSDFDAFADAILNKLVREIAGLPEEWLAVAPQIKAPPGG